jgi:hypothetical protein
MNWNKLLYRAIGAPSLLVGCGILVYTRLYPIKDDVVDVVKELGRGLKDEYMWLSGRKFEDPLFWTGLFYGTVPSL